MGLLHLLPTLTVSETYNNHCLQAVNLSQKSKPASPIAKVAVAALVVIVVVALVILLTEEVVGVVEVVWVEVTVIVV